MDSFAGEPKLILTYILPIPLFEVNGDGPLFPGPLEALSPLLSPLPPLAHSQELLQVGGVTGRFANIVGGSMIPVTVVIIRSHFVLFIITSLL